MEKLIEGYLKEVLLISKPKVRFINKDYINSNKVLFTFSSEYSKSEDTKQELNIWELLEYTYNKTS